MGIEIPLRNQAADEVAAGIEDIHEAVPAPGTSSVFS